MTGPIYDAAKRLVLNPVRNEIKVFPFNLLMADVYVFANRVTQLA